MFLAIIGAENESSSQCHRIIISPNLCSVMTSSDLASYLVVSLCDYCMRFESYCMSTK